MISLLLLLIMQMLVFLLLVEFVTVVADMYKMLLNNGIGKLNECVGVHGECPPALTLCIAKK